MPDFTHLHCHSCYSLLDGATRVDDLVRSAKNMGMDAIALTDHGYVHGLPEFYEACEKEGVKPIIGFEAYMVDDVARVKEEKDSTRFHQILLAKNDTGLDNLNKLASWAATTGYYYKPLIDFEQLEKHSEGVIATSSCLNSMISKAIVRGDMAEAEEISRWFQRVFGRDFYFEVHNHGYEPERKVREGIKELAPKLGVDVICANDVHYVEEDDRRIQVSLMNLRMERSKAEEYSHERLHLASPNEMAQLFADEFPDSLDNTMKLAESIDVTMPFGRDPVLPQFPVPEPFQNEGEYLAHLTRESIPLRYPKPTHEEARRRLEHELKIIDQMGYNRYFLIVQQITSAARERGVRVGPGRGSAAGSIVSYLLGITNTDPLKYDLIFERFLNPERVTMPDIDIDFADHRRDEVIDWIVGEYGQESVSQIVTFGELATNSAIRDMARTVGFSPAETNDIAKRIPSKPQVSEEEKMEIFFEHDKLQELAEKDGRMEELYSLVPRVQGMTRQTGVHACGVLITPGPVSDYMPVFTTKSKGKKTRVTQWEGDYTEDFGLLKMDILGLSTLSVIDKTLEMVEANYGVEINMDEIPEDDKKTWELFQRGETTCIFQFESDGMQGWLKQLEPTEMNDLVAMNALYRPGPMKLIPNYIDRKHGKEDVDYFHPDVVDILEPTYGIMVFQEQIMKVAQRVAGFSLGQADILRRAVGKKKRKLLEKQKRKFVEGCIDNGNSREKAEEIFDLIEEFADYGFNRSHAAAYSEIAYQTGYLKAHYPTEFMAANLDVYSGDKDKKPRYLSECRRMGISVRPPDVNVSGHDFTAKVERGADLSFIDVQMSSANVAKIINGEKTTTVRSSRQAREIGLETGESALVRFSETPFQITCRGKLSIDEAGGKRAMWASEGFDADGPQFEQTRRWMEGEGKLWVYDIEPAEDAVGRVYYGLSAVKHVSDSSADDIIDYREGDPYTSFVDFLLRHQAGPESSVNSRVVEALAKVGAFDDLPVNEDGDDAFPIDAELPDGDRGAMLAVLEDNKKFLGKLRNHRRGTRVSKPSPPAISEFHPVSATFDQRLGWEQDFLGDFITAHPMNGYEPIEEMIGVLAGVAPNKEVAMSGSGQGRVYPYVGYISSVDVKPTRSGKNKGKKRADFVLLTREGAKNINVWWRTYKKHKAHIEEGRRVVVLAKKWTPDESKTFVPAETIVPIGQVVTDWSRLLVVKPHRATYGSMQQIEKVFDRMEPGEVSTILVVGSEESARKYKGPSVRLTPRRMRELSSRAEVQIR